MRKEVFVLNYNLRIIQMKSALSVILFFAFNVVLIAQTQVSGTIASNSIWKKSNSPYIITSGVLINENIILTIEAGVSVEIESNSGIVLRGKLKALGNKNDSITFSPKGTNSWQGITIDNKYNARVSCNYFKASGADLLFFLSKTSQIDTVLVLTNSRFVENKTVIEADDSNDDQITVIENCKFENTANYVFLYSGNCTVKNSKFTNNWGTNHLGQKIYDGGGFYNNRLTETRIENSTFSGFETATAINGSIINSEFYNNQRAVVTQNENSPFMRYNNIHDNVNGLETWIISGSNPSNQIKYNKICNNFYNVYQIHSGDANVMDNCWCTEDKTEIEDKIFDLFDKNTLGVVNYLPIDTLCSYDHLINGGKVKPENENNSIVIYPNPAEEKVFIQINSSSELQNLNWEFKITNTHGQVLQFVRISNNQLVIDLQGASNGLYIFSATNNVETLSQKFIKR